MENLIIEYTKALLEKRKVRYATDEEYDQFPNTQDVDITWGDLIDVLEAKISSINKLKKAKLIFKVLGASSIESSAELGLEAADAYINVANSITKNCLKIVEPIALETLSTSTLNKVNKKIKKYISSKTKSVEETLACFLLKFYKTKTDDSFLKNLTLDDNISKIIDDDIEIEFLISLSEKIIYIPGVSKRSISQWSINDLLKEYLMKNYNNRTVTGYKGS